MDEEAAVSEYLQAAREPTPQERAMAQQHETLQSDWRSVSSRFPMVPVLILVIVTVGAVAGWKLYRDHLRQPKAAPVEAGIVPQASSSKTAADSNRQKSPSAAPQKQAGTGVSKAAPQRRPNSPTASPATSAQSAARALESAVVSYTAGSSPFVVTIRPKSRAWVAVKADGKSVVRGIIKPPAVKTIHASDQVVFYTGNAGAVEVAFDGKDVPVSGGANDARVLLFKAPGTQAAARAPSP